MDTCNIKRSLNVCGKRDQTTQMERGDYKSITGSIIGRTHMEMHFYFVPTGWLKIKRKNKTGNVTWKNNFGIIL